MDSSLDAHGQPHPAFNAARRRDRAVHEMLGLVKGVIIDGEVSVGEAQYLASWINSNPEAIQSWPGSSLAERLIRIFQDGRIDDDEREDLLFFLQNMAGPNQGQHGDSNVATRLPIDDPAPRVNFNTGEFVFTGRFLWGTRKKCEEAVMLRGGECGDSITKRTRTLVIGELGSRDWAHTSFGRKIQKAVDYRAEGLPLIIIDEEHWVRHL